MGGFGSGRQKYSEAPMVHECFALRVSDLLQGGCLEVGEGETGYFLRPAIVEVRRRAGRLYLTIGHTEQVVPLASTALHFGGVRWWFACPGCGRRCAALYSPHKEDRYQCRLCWGLAYESERGNHSADGFCRAIVEQGKAGDLKEARRMFRVFVRFHKQPKRWVRRRDRGK